MDFTSKMKYIMVDHNRPVLFLDTWTHEEMAKCCCRGTSKVTGAGFCYVYKHGEIICHGESESLGGLKPGEHDDCYIMKALDIDTEGYGFE